MRGTRILLLGIAYKAATSDWRESPSIAVAERLAALGAELQRVRPAHPRGAPAGLDDGARRVQLPRRWRPPTSCVVLVDHPEFDPDDICRHAPLVFDAKGILRGRTFAGETL